MGKIETVTFCGVCFALQGLLRPAQVHSNCSLLGMLQGADSCLNLEVGPRGPDVALLVANDCLKDHIYSARASLSPQTPKQPWRWNDNEQHQLIPAILQSLSFLGHCVRGEDDGSKCSNEKPPEHSQGLRRALAALSTSAPHASVRGAHA